MSQTIVNRIWTNEDGSTDVLLRYWIIQSNIPIQLGFAYIAHSYKSPSSRSKYTPDPISLTTTSSCPNFPPEELSLESTGVTILTFPILQQTSTINTPILNFSHYKLQHQQQLQHQHQQQQQPQQPQHPLPIFNSHISIFVLYKFH